MKNSRIYSKFESDEIFSKLKKFFMTYGSRLKSFLNKFLIFRNILGYFSPKDLFITREIKLRKFDYLSGKEIKKNFKILNNVFKKKTKFRIKKIDESVFLIQNNNK